MVVGSSIFPASGYERKGRIPLNKHLQSPYFPNKRAVDAYKRKCFAKLTMYTIGK
jgi:hypothetical protein